jgi:predicted MPP superfamily phosphohydrolase
MVVLTGDLVDRDAAFAPRLGELVRRLSELRTRDGVVVIPGNHDYYSGIDAVLSAAAEGGARVLRNEGRVIGDAGGAFALLGVDDVWAPRQGYGKGPDFARTVAMVPDDLPRILLCHNPEFFPDVRGRIALQLSGHTHAGQVNLGLRPAEFVLPYVEGLYAEEGSQLYVNRGFGTAGPPARVGAPPEVTLVVLTAA